MRWLTLGLVTMAVGCGGEAVEAPGGPDTGASGGWAAVPPLAEPGGAGGLGGAGGAPPPPEPEEPAPEPWKPEPRPEPLPGRPGFGDPCQRSADCEIPGVTGDSLICHAGRCGFLCDRWQGLDIVPSEYLERLCASDYERTCTSTGSHGERATCTRPR